MSFKEINMDDFNQSVCKLIGKDWSLITACKKDGSVNTMTASWGGIGVMWGENAAFTFIRPQRFTKEFVDESETYSITFFDEKYKSQLAYLGKVSGRNENKIEKSGLTVVFDARTPYFKEAKIVLICEKLFAGELPETSFIDKNVIDKWYPDKDFHIMYVSRIKKVLIRE